MIVVFDAECLLCNGWVQFLLRNDRRGDIRFASIQGVNGMRLLDEVGLKTEGLDTLLVIQGNRRWQYSAAIFQVLHQLGWPWRLAWVAWLIPSVLRDAAYRFIARNRYWIFGRSETCILPPADFATRFLD
ncbi:putative DCC family thiol-disulfide oxidoreductase YuxK [Hydrogenophaga palleronii]|uniref:DCC family thiol-disulfide oxidoreductase YuxK n=1 Tax=Hydrogenophaga palleronii TaxID=65655 RepID=A0ABU1WK93_9BURK|nr:thiol-disulfide oxidoreductase DCC family protein [Hydrogenophaga palleronii]MDR7149705.1 putative DCC family thiol-disulfide oxidoreductase YuxK [Hydrogenophaga palleronii]